jgi:hypothetical protein
VPVGERSNDRGRVARRLGGGPAGQVTKRRGLTK